MQPDSYFIKSNYTPNRCALTSDSVSGCEYWNKNWIYSSHFYQYYVYQYALNIIKKTVARSVIDIGCGVGTKLSLLHRHFPTLDYVGIDQHNPIDYCKANYKFGTWYADDFNNPDPALGKLTADLVICSDVIEHLEEPNILLRYLKSKAAPNSYILLSTPERDILQGKNCTDCPNKHHVREWNFQELNNYLTHNGFTILEHFLQYPVRFAFNGIFLREIVKRVLQFKSAKYNQVCLLRVS